MVDQNSSTDGINYSTSRVKALFLTYVGIMRVMISSRTGVAKKFINWAIETLFIIHLGTEEQKQKLASTILNADLKTVKAVFSKTAHTIPCIYLIKLSKVKDLRTSMSLDSKYHDDDILYKYGMSKNIERRMEQHTKDFAKYKIKPELDIFSYIDIQYISRAETDISHIFDSMGMKVSVASYTELVVIPSKQYKIIKKQYESIGKLYLGHIEDLIRKI